VNPTMTPSGVEQTPGPQGDPGPKVNPTMTPSGVEQTAYDFNRKFRPAE